MKKRLLSLFMGAFLLVGVGFAQGVNAEWRQGANGWNYYQNGALKTGWLFDNSKWYFLDIYGNMQTGWVSDNGTWYYMSSDGSLDNSKTLHSIPNELVDAISKVEPYAKEKVTYYQTVTYSGNIAYVFLPMTQLKYGTPSYYYVPSTGRIFEITEGILVRLDVNQLMNAKYTFEQCKSIADEALKGEANKAYTISSDGTVNKWGEYYFTGYSTSDNQKIDAFYVSGFNGQIRR